MEELSPPVKDAFHAEVFRRRGNKSYKDRDLKEALKLYNKVRVKFTKDRFMAAYWYNTNALIMCLYSGMSIPWTH